MKERINEILGYLQLSSAQFADTIGVQRSSISHILSGRNKPSFDFIQKILLKYPNFNANWLITGNGTMLSQSDDKIDNHKAKFEGNLFSKTPENKSLDTKSAKSEPEQNNPLDLISESSFIPPKNTEVTNVNKVKSIIIVYEDDTFKYLNSK